MIPSRDFRGLLAAIAVAMIGMAEAHAQAAWRLLRAPDPRGGPDAVSIAKTADISRSDPDFAGLMLRCGVLGTELLVIVVEPRPPRTRPWVKISVAGAEARFESTIAPPFTALLLPGDAAALLTARRQSAAEVAVEVEGDRAPIHGIVPLAGLEPALHELAANCRSQ
jgi:hypothetical protein